MIDKYSTATNTNNQAHVNQTKNKGHPTHLAMAAEEGMETPPEDLLLDFPIDVGAVEGGDRYRRRCFKRTTGRSGGHHHFVGGF
jgi:hypothetical protein